MIELAFHAPANEAVTFSKTW